MINGTDNILLVIDYIDEATKKGKEAIADHRLSLIEKLRLLGVIIEGASLIDVFSSAVDEIKDLTIQEAEAIVIEIAKKRNIPLKNAMQIWEATLHKIEVFKDFIHLFL